MSVSNLADKDLIPLTETEITSRLKSLPGWKYASDKIIKMFEFVSFTDAIQFINGLVVFCNSLDHHPDINISYNKVRFELTTRDFTVAQKIESSYFPHLPADRQV